MPEFNIWIVLVLVSCVNIASCFLSDGNTKAVTNPALMTDSHYTTLLNLLTEERKAREQLQQYVVQLSQDINSFDAFNKSLQHELSVLKLKLDNLERLNTTPDKVTLRAFATGAIVKAGSIIQFETIQVSEGLIDLSRFKQYSVFVCKTPGIYIISVHINTNTNTDDLIGLYINSRSASDIYRFQHNYYMTMTTTVIEKLNINDQVWLQNGHVNMSVVGGAEQSFINIVQIR